MLVLAQKGLQFRFNRLGNHLLCPLPDSGTQGIAKAFSRLWCFEFNQVILCHGVFLV